MIPSWSNAGDTMSMSQWPTEFGELEARNLNVNQTSNIHNLVDHQSYVLHVISVSLSAISLAAALVVSSWFYRMKRSFRHDLIMLLIHCDILRCIWFLSFPAVELVYGTILSSSPFCQASGFFLAFSIEMSDMSVAMIAIHTALYIFRGEEGLYPYRKIAYTIAVAIPLCLASLAFINNPGYVNTGRFCYLPVEPFWVRKALSWIPRYLAFSLIFATYIAIYVYVRYLMRQFTKLSNQSRRESISLLDTMQGGNSPSKESHDTVPPTPPIVRHGLVSSTPASNRTSRDGRCRQFSVVSAISTLNVDGPRFSSRYSTKASRKRDSGVNWKMPNFNADAPTYNERLQSEAYLGDPAMGGGNAEELATLPDTYVRDLKSTPSSSKPTTPLEEPAPNVRDSRAHSVADSSTALPSRNPSPPHLLISPIQGALNSSSTSGKRSMQARPSVIQSLTPLDADGMIQTREKIRRQLRQLFFYPVVYIIVWILPFIVHHTGYGRGAPFGMVAASVVFISLQGLADALIFSVKESPWRHPESKAPCKLRFWKRSDVQEASNNNVGRTREEMMRDGRNARERRDAELKDLRAEVRDEASATRKPAAEWWDNGRDDQLYEIESRSEGSNKRSTSGTETV